MQYAFATPATADLSATFMAYLLAAAPDDPDAELYTVEVYDDTGTVIATGPGSLDVVWLPSIGRIGIAWGGDAVWADAASVDAGIDLYLNDTDAWEAAN